MTVFKTSSNGRALIEAYEGTILVAYDDANDRVVPVGGHARGTLTIGTGHTSAAGPPHVYVGMTITKEQADAILSADLASVEQNVLHHVVEPMNQNQFDAFVSFDYNLGALDRSNVLAYFNAGHIQHAADAMLQWDHARGVELSGLNKRRHAERSLFMTGKWAGP